MRIPSGVTDQGFYFVALDATDLKTRETGLSSFTVVRSRNGAADATFTTPTVTEIDNTTMPGLYFLLCDEDMTITSGDDSQEMAFHITHAGMAPVTRVIELYRSKITHGNTLGVESDGDLTKVNTLDGHTAQTGDTYARLGAPAGASHAADVAAVKTQTAAIETDTQDIQSRIPSSLTSRGFMKSDSFIAELTVTSVSGGQTSPVCSGGTTTSDRTYDYAVAIITDVTNGDTCLRDILEWDGSTGQITLNAATPFTLAVGDKIVVHATSYKNSLVLPTSATPGTDGGLVRVGNNASTTFDVLAAAFLGNITGNLSGSVGSVTAGVSLANDAITASKFDESTAFPQTGDVYGALTGAHSEPTGVPAANASILTKIGTLFMMLRNKVTVTSTKKTYYDDGDAAEFEKDLSDDGTTYTESEVNSI